MGECFLYGTRGGGSVVDGTGLNILYGGERPETAEENTIWIGSSEAASGACVLSPNAPEGKPGLVWIKTGTSGLSVTIPGPANVVLCLRDALLYQDDSWTPIAEAGIYRDGNWLLFCESYLMLYKSGNVYADTTGGYSDTLPFLDVVYNYSPSFGSDSVFFDSHYRGQKFMISKNRLVLDRYSKLVVDWYVSQVTEEDPNNTLAVYVLDSTRKNAVAQLFYGPLCPRKTDVLDISGLEKNKEYYIAVSTNVNTPMVGNLPSTVAMTGYLYSLELQV